ncbi:MAG: hypothetical protein DCF25_09685 [Leptolyngbya foveolarum]|uniref:Uncharacterized protein n=1 Tax=Leptolyngbya foveolarum TaxID=47253 RepID=A0A2W4UNJ8_9CYAN|nr:MAG: hypothetical protein DCF25_09685 [Leptolyngbya foveolarum]
MAGSMRTKLLVGIIGSIALVVLLSQGLMIYTQGSCGQYPILEPACSELLSVAETQKLLQSKQSAVNELMQISPGMIDISVQPQSRCPGKGMIVVFHPSERDCDSLNEIIRRDFSDIPYKIVNN